MRSKKVVSFSAIGVFVAAMALGCGEGTDVPLTKAPVPTPAPTQDLTKKPMKGSAGLSGKMMRNPGGDPLAR